MGWVDLGFPVWVIWVLLLWCEWVFCDDFDGFCCYGCGGWDLILGEWVDLFGPLFGGWENGGKFGLCMKEVPELMKDKLVVVVWAKPALKHRWGGGRHGVGDGGRGLGSGRRRIEVGLDLVHLSTDLVVDIVSFRPERTEYLVPVSMRWVLKARGVFRGGLRASSLEVTVQDM
uniref:Secreted protein n=1 Tax=Fagus sylvatica TaxID=28930 RepID=A0A2N9FTS9_FAGSY